MLWIKHEVVNRYFAFGANIFFYKKENKTGTGSNRFPFLSCINFAYWILSGSTHAEERKSFLPFGRANVGNRNLKIRKMHSHCCLMNIYNVHLEV